MEEDNIIKTLFVNQRYDEVVDSLETIFTSLFEDMLEYKGIEYQPDDMTYPQLCMHVLDYYPQYDEQILRLTHVGFDPHKSYLEVINNMLSIYIFISEGYKEEYEEDEDIDFSLYE